MRKTQPKMSESHHDSSTLRRRWVFAPNLSVLYCVNPKAGGTSMRHLLGCANAKFRHQHRFFLPSVPGHLLRFDVPDTSSISILKMAAPGHLLVSDVPDTVKGYATLYQIADNEDHFRMTFVRNPYARVLSAYLNKILTQKIPIKGVSSFEGFVNFISKENPYEMDPHWIPQTLKTGIKSIDYDFIGRLENFEEDAGFLFGDEALVPVNIGAGRRHATNALQRTMEFYTPGLADTVYEIYREDFELFGYSKKLEDASSWEPSHKLPRAVLHPKSCSPLTRFLITILHDPPPPSFKEKPVGLQRSFKRGHGLRERYLSAIRLLKRLLKRLLAAGT